MAIGIIAEFNPFHNGHKYLMEQAKKHSHEPIAVIMSGSFMQRGDIAITDKWTRAYTVLQNGADLVLELPVTFSMNTAQRFAYGAVFSLAATGIIDTLCFGSESGNLADLTKAAKLISNEPPEISAKIKSFMDSGMSYPSARAKAYGGELNALSSPNDILATEYLRAANDCGADFKFVPVTRIGTGHDSAVAAGSLASASEIRRRIRNNEKTVDFLPYTDIFPVYNSSRLDTAITANLRKMTHEALREINDVSEGLENRIKKAAYECDTLETLCTAIKSKRYTLSRIRRIVWSSLLGLTKDICSFNPEYLRVLGMNNCGKALLKKMKTTASLPIITKPADFSGSEIFDINSAAEDIFSLCAPTSELRRGRRDITTTPVIIGD